MNNFMNLLLGELHRMKKYKIMTASFVAALIWIGVLYFTDIKDVSDIFPVLIFVDATAMSMLMIGVTMFFEKQEGVLKSLLVSPINKAEFILSKTFANILSNVITLLVLYAYAKLFKEIHINLTGLILSVILIAVFHSLIGYLLTYYSKDFTSMLVAMFKYTIVLTIPVILEQIGVLNIDLISKILYVIPTKSSMLLLQATIGNAKTWETILSIAYMSITTILLYFVVSKKFDEYAIKESGV